MILSMGILPLAFVVLFALFYGREVVRHEWLMILTAPQWLVVGTVGLIGLVVVLRAVFVTCSRRITANNLANRPSSETIERAQPPDSVS